MSDQIKVIQANYHIYLPLFDNKSLHKRYNYYYQNKIMKLIAYKI